MNRSIIKQFALALCLLCALKGGAYDFLANGIFYNINSDGTTVSVTFDDYYKYTGSVTIPESVTYNGKSYIVSTIGNSAFKNCTDLTSVTIPESVTYIEEQSFYSCRGLSSLTIPKSISSIGKYAFVFCSGIEHLVWNAINCSSNGDLASYNIEHLEIGDEVESLPQNFVTGAKITSVFIPNSVKIIGDAAFYSCEALNQVIICNSVTSIGNSAFSRCESLTNINIPNSVNTIGDGAFSLSGLESIIIPNSVTTIGDGAFSNCDSLLSVNLPNSITSISNNLFSRCHSLESVNIPTSINSIGGGAFSWCYSLKRIYIPSSVININKNAFSACHSLTRIAIPSSVTSIGYCAFSDCPSVTSIIVESENPIYDSRDNCNAIIETSSNTLIAGCKNTIIPNSITTISNYAFDYCTSLSKMIIPKSVASIGESAFYCCGNVQSYQVEKDNLVYDSREDCNAIIETSSNTLLFGCKNTIIPNTITSISGNSFRYCSGLTCLTIPSSVTSIGTYAFWLCNDLDTVICLAETPPLLDDREFKDLNVTLLKVPQTSINDYKVALGWRNIKNIEAIIDCFEINGLYYKKIAENKVCVTFKDENYNSYSGNIVIPSSVSFDGDTYQVTEIGEYAFRFSENLTSVTIPNSVKRIGNCAFQDCYALKSISIPNSVEEIGTAAFDNAGITFMALGNGLKVIGDNAFCECKFTSVTLPEGLLTIGENAFSHCSEMTSINLPGTLTSIGEKAFDMCVKLTGIVIPKSVNHIGATILEECQSLISIKVESGNTVYDSRNNCNAIIETASNTLIEGCQSSFIPNSVLAIGDYAFALCSGLKTITIPTYVKTIGHAAFMGCSSLNTIMIGANVTSLGEYAFFDCDNVTNVTCFAALPPSLYSIECFSSCAYDNAVLRVPATSFENYIFSEYWSEFLNIETLVNGDVDGDGKVNISDVTTLIDMLLRGTTANANADIDGDGNVNISDVTTLIDILLRQ